MYLYISPSQIPSARHSSTSAVCTIIIAMYFLVQVYSYFCKFFLSLIFLFLQLCLYMTKSRRMILKRQKIMVQFFLSIFLSLFLILVLLNSLYRFYAQNSRNNTSNARINSFNQGRGIICDVIYISTIAHEFQGGIYQ